jgi:nicotinamidase-related amidase
MPMSDTALLVIDMLNAYEHPDAEQLVEDVVTATYVTSMWWCHPMPSAWMPIHRAAL